MRSFSQIVALGTGAAASFASTLATEREVPFLTAPCDALSSLLPGAVNFPKSAAYIEDNVYWSNRQAEVHPQCFVTPRNASEVSIIIKTLARLAEPFAVKSGGHAAFPGASNLADGVTIDLVHLDEITLSEDKNTVSVGPGSRWINVSQALDPLGLAVVGGRAADVGVGGLVLGGGISYFSGKYGWACDNVRNFEVVVASGEVVNASPTENPDLYWALRGGGGSSFGIVTRFDLVAFAQGPLWTNTLIFPGAANKTLIPLYTDLTQKGLVEDHDAHTYLVLSYVSDLGGFITLTSFYHSTPPPNDTIPPVFEPFQSVPGAVQNITQVTSISAQSIAIDEAYGSRQTWWDTSVDISSPELLMEIVNLWQVHVSKMLEATNGTEFLPFLVFQPISQNIIEAMQKNGGNALGLKPQDGPLMIVQLASTWADKSLDEFIEKASAEFIQDVEAMAKSKGLCRGFVYMNYAGKSQDVLRRYGDESYARLQATAGKWDPRRVFHYLWRGYFQVGRD